MNKQDLEYLCQKLRNGEYNGKDIMQAWIAIEELLSLKENTLKYKLNQKVQVKVYNFIKTGIIVKRRFYETNLGTNFKYTVIFGEDFGDYIDVWEQDLNLAQELPLGEMK